MNISTNPINSKIECPTSKSYANRALILAALKEGPVTLHDVPEAQDVKDMIFILKKLGLQITEMDRSLAILNSFPACEVKTIELIELELGEGGTTVRFLYPLIALGENQYKIKTSGRISKRPMNQLYEVLNRLGAKVTSELIQGPLKLDQGIEIDCSKTTQFASAFIHLSLNSELKVVTKNILASQKYIDMTYEMIKHFKKSSEYIVPADFSSAGYMIAYGVLKQNLNLQNIFYKDEFQADAKLLNILDQIGGDYKFSAEGLDIFRTDSFLKGIDIDGSQCIDLVPTLMFIAAFLPFESKIKKVESLRYKECDRLREMMKILDHFSIRYTYSNSKDEFIILPSKPKAISAVLEVTDDHRMVMVGSLFYKMLNGGDVSPSHSVNKSFPSFFDIF